MHLTNAIAILNHLCNSCRHKPPVVAPMTAGVGTGALPLHICTTDLGLLYIQTEQINNSLTLPRLQLLELMPRDADISIN